VVDLRNRVSYAQGHVAGSFNFELEGQLATYLAWLVPWGKPITLLAETPEQITAAQRELVQVGIDRPAAAATGDPAQWAGDAAALRSFPRAGFSALAKARKSAAAGTAEKIVVLDVRRASEQANGRIDGSVHIPLHQLHRRLDEVPAGTIWVHCVSGMRAAIAASMLDAAGRSVVAVDDSFQSACDIGIVIEPLSS
jgi:rhodanese-related sulfurtransferase